MRSKWSFPGIVILSSLVLLGGCGGSNDASGGSAGTGGGGSNPPPAAVAPAITTQPSDQSVTAGQAASFSVTASGTAPLSYQWQRNGAAISGATGSTYAVSSTAVADTGAKFAVVVTNSAGSATSNAATLTATAATQTVSAASGGQVNSADGFLTLKVPPGALTADATVTVSSSSDWVAPHALPSQFAVVPGTTHVISAQGGSFDPARQFGVTVSTGVLNAPQTSAKTTRRPTVRPAAKGNLQPQAASISTFEDLGLVADCGDGNPIIIMLPPSTAANGYDSGTFIAGCPPGEGGAQLITLAVVTYTNNSQPTAPSGNVLWDSAVPYTPDTTPNSPLCVSCDSYTHSDTWIGSSVRSIATSSIPYNTAGSTLVSLVDDNGHPIARFTAPVAVTGVILDGPWNFYLALGRDTTIAYVAHYAMEYKGSGWQATQQWETTLTGAPATSDGTIDEPNVTGTAFAVDPQSGDLVALAGDSGIADHGKLTADDIARLGLDADGFVVRINRSGILTAATAVVSTQPVSYDNTALTSQRSQGYVLRVDHAGDVYVATLLCCQSAGPHRVSGLTLKKISNTGVLVWEAAVASPDEVASPIPGIGAGDDYAGYVGAIAVDATNDANLTYYHADANPANAGHLYTVKVAADTGDVSAVGYVDPTVDQSHYDLAYGDGGSASYIDANGNLYLYLEFAGSPTVARLVALNPSLHVIGTTALPDFRFNQGVQIDASGNIYQQTTLYNAQAGTITPDLRKFHYELCASVDHPPVARDSADGGDHGAVRLRRG